MTRGIFVAGLLAMASVLAIAASGAGAATPTVVDFQGRWTVSRVLGSSPGGVTNENPRRMVGRIVEWNDTAVRLAGKTCLLRDPAVRVVPNRTLEDSIWGGQTISGLTLSRHEAARAFGSAATPVFEDRDGCAYAVLVDHDAQIMMFPSGYIYLLKRSGR